MTLAGRVIVKRHCYFGMAACLRTALISGVLNGVDLSCCAVQLAAMRQRDPSAKALIFTQFNSTLEWLMSRLTQEGYGYRTISGSMPLKKRSQVCLNR